MRRVDAVSAAVEKGILNVSLADGQYVQVVFDEYGLPHRGRKLTTTTTDGYIVEIMLPYDVRVITKIDIPT